MTRFEVNGRSYVVVLPSADVIDRADAAYRAAYGRAVAAGAPKQADLDSVLRSRGLWDDARQAEVDELMRSIDDAVAKLQAGFASVEDGRLLAVHIGELRRRRVDLLSLRMEVENKTAEARAADAAFDYLLTCCLLDGSSGKPLFRNTKHYRANAHRAYARRGAAIFAGLLVPEFDPDPEWRDNLPENAWLRKHGLKPPVEHK